MGERKKKTVGSRSEREEGKVEAHSNRYRGLGECFSKDSELPGASESCDKEKRRGEEK